jgi:hypothetical protein
LCESCDGDRHRDGASFIETQAAAKQFGEAIKLASMIKHGRYITLFAIFVYRGDVLT